MSDQIEIRLLGRLWIRLGNGQVVPASQWTTGKTTDLLRLLALRSDQIVSSASLVEKLWPDVTPAKASASLHTATLQIRKVLGKNSVMRHLSGLQLQGCWVDVTAHDSLALEIGSALRSREFPRVVAAAKQAEALYVDDFHAHDDESAWAADIRDELRAKRKLMLVDAAESAIELGWLRDAVEMSTLAISLDSCFERAHRALMRAYAGIGEADATVRSYERCRRNLKTGLGVAPSPMTEALYLTLTSSKSEYAAYSTYVGRERSLADLSAAIRHSSRGDGTDVIFLSGLPGSGRQSLLQAAADRVPGSLLRPVRPPKVARQAPVERMTQPPGLTDIAVMGPVDTPPARARIAIAEVLATIPPQHGRVLVVVTTQETARLLEEEEESSSPYQAHFVESPLLNQRELEELAMTILAGLPSPDLVATLKARSESMAGIATEILRAWVSTGQIISTVRGLALVSDSLTSTVLPSASSTFRVLAEQLEPAEIEICQLMAVLDRAVSAAEIMEFLGSQRRTESRRLEIEARMDHLTRRGIFQADNDMYAFRDRTTQDLFELWLRPSLQANIVSRIDVHQLDTVRPNVVVTGVSQA
ncbi:MAG: BTAD domain-containing putative transcriptional regulator [Aeromicrobium sp.]